MELGKTLKPQARTKDPLAIRFGQLVASHRRRVDIGQEELARRAGVSRDLISKIETGGSGARFPNIQKIADALGVDPAELFSAEFPKGSLLRPELAELMARLAKLSEADFAWAKGVIDAALRNK